MIHYNQLHIPAPCDIHYDDLPYDPEKRPCFKCQKPVYDFRDKDEKFLNDVWKKHKGDFCGAFAYEQFDRFYPNPTPNLWNKLKATFWGYLLTLLSFTSRAQNSDIELPEKPKTDSVITSSKSFMVMTKEGRKLAEHTNISIYINNSFYKSMFVKDSSIVYLPDSARRGDLITIKNRKRVFNNGFTKIVRKTKAVEFILGDEDVIEVETHVSRRIRLIYKRTRVGCPKFR